MDQEPLAQNEWEDTFLVDDWAIALEEYRIYHSIQAKGGTVEEAENDLKALRSKSDAKPETEGTSGPIENDNDSSEPSAAASGNIVSAPRSDETPSAEKETGGTQELGPSSQSEEEAAFRAAAFAPHSLMSTIPDDAMKSLCLSWYYAGYHTGIVEGRRQQMQLQGKPSEG